MGVLEFLASCDICGKPAVGRAIVEKAEVNVCNVCARYGRMLSTPRQQAAAAHLPMSQKEVLLVQGYGVVISRARTAVGLTRMELAAKLNLREKDVEHFEAEKTKPTDGDVRKLENFLKIKLLTESIAVAPAAVQRSRSSFSGITLADIVEIKDKRKQR